MAATDQLILDEARDSLLRILSTDTSSWSESARNQQQLQIRDLQALIREYEGKPTVTLQEPVRQRRIWAPVRRVDF